MDKITQPRRRHAATLPRLPSKATRSVFLTLSHLFCILGLPHPVCVLDPCPEMCHVQAWGKWPNAADTLWHGRTLLPHRVTATSQCQTARLPHCVTRQRELKASGLINPAQETSYQFGRSRDKQSIASELTSRAAIPRQQAAHKHSMPGRPVLPWSVEARRLPRPIESYRDYRAPMSY